jgi:hypothetical protein
MMRRATTQEFVNKVGMNVEDTRLGRCIDKVPDSTVVQ